MPDETTQAEIVWEGDPIAERAEGHFNILLMYREDLFFELYYDLTCSVIQKIVAFTRQQWIDSRLPRN